MKSIQLCPDCGGPLPIDAVEGLCPQCLLRSTVLTDPDDAERQESAVRSQEPIPGCSFGDYRIVRLLGRGGMGAVFEAEQIESGRRVALKVLSHAPDSPTARQRFLREGRLAASINHPNSVYIFGTEEIDGTPVITMEYVSGGTLAELVERQGPMPVGEAVDTIQQIITGLEAAAKKGVLHRDVKPSNCFIEAGGAVKVGDFGLSVSTLARDQTNVTVAGTMMGTPAYASPEQLRGDELDIRSDIYSVGVTLYFLLTGRTPFQSENMISLIATVLEKPAPSPGTVRPEIPEALAAIVLRCLAKQPEQRFKDYEQLQQALLPLGSAEPTAAPLGLRSLAGVLDGFVLGLLTMVATKPFIRIQGIDDPLTSGERSPGMLWFVAVVPFVIRLLYFSVFEGLSGCTLGKYICGLRVIGPNRNRPGIPRACVRALMVVSARFFPMWVWWFAGGSTEFDPQVQTTGLVFYFVIVALYFITARRRNGFAAAHDLLTGTRVVKHAVYERRSQLTPGEHSSHQTTDAPNVGPFHVLDSLACHGGEEILLGYDTRLLRKVWIRKLPPGSEPIPVAVRDLNRKGRLHWLAGQRSASECWDAYEAIAGQPLVHLIKTPQPWESVRFWLQDLAEELDAARQDGSMLNPPGLERVWITADGRAKLLDFAAPGSSPSEAPSNPFAGGTERTVDPQGFLHLVAYAALTGGELPVQKNDGVPQIPLPMCARQFLKVLPAIPDLQSVISQLRPLLDKPAFVSNARRRGLMYLSIMIGFFFNGIVSMITGSVLIRDGQPGLNPLLSICSFAIPGLVAASLMRRGLGYRLLHVEIVTRTGLPARRWRTFLRCLLAWLPFFVMLLLGHLSNGYWPIWMFICCVIGGIVYRVIYPGRPIRDRIADTWLVPE